MLVGTDTKDVYIKKTLEIYFKIIFNQGHRQWGKNILGPLSVGGSKAVDSGGPMWWNAVSQPKTHPCGSEAAFFSWQKNAYQYLEIFHSHT